MVNLNVSAVVNSLLIVLAHFLPKGFYVELREIYFKYFFTKLKHTIFNLA